MNKTNKQEEALNSEKVHAENHDENCIGKCIKFNLIVVLVTLCWLNKVLKNSDQRSCHGFHTFRDVGSGGAGGRKPPQILAPPPRFLAPTLQLALPDSQTFRHPCTWENASFQIKINKFYFYLLLFKKLMLTYILI